ncbi:hypothetical protein FRC04_011686 [Tulasnella sp. 424]|nr:hypothetical protein FRC04_011686 [Tulasnella sp. 424]KAG8978031.1 hypothetical protein FRC05_011146 [Tulasnella sp. 425]
MIALSALTALAAFLVTGAQAHGGVTSWSIGSTTYPGWQPYLPAAQQSVTAGRPYTSYDPILNPTAATIHCNDDGNAGPNPTSININPGDTIVGHYPQWTHAEGPVTVYLAACNAANCNGVNSGTVKWFKIAETGLISGTLAAGSWANGILMANLQWPAKIPTNLKAGAYLLRMETLALHQANTPQFYPECVQLIVGGSGTALPPASYQVSIPGAWTASDPGVMVDIYSDAAKTQTTYIIPGPRVWSGFTGIDIPGGSNPTTTAGGTTTTPTQGGTTSKPTTTTTTTTTTASGPKQTHYGQCGGQGYSGPTVCADPYKCTYSSQFYSQCL